VLFLQKVISVAIDVVGNPLVFLSSCYDRAISRVVGGHCFGPRYLTDVFPACILITILLWSHASKTLSHRPRNVLMTIFCFFSIISIFINTYQGLYNPATAQWNVATSTYKSPDYLFDWKYPQFMATPKLLKERELYYHAKTEHNEIQKTERQPAAANN
jgi:hypothetical protein